MAARPMNQFAIGDRPKTYFAIGDLLWPLHRYSDSCKCVRALTHCVEVVLGALPWTEAQTAAFRDDLRVLLVELDAQEKRCKLQFSLFDDPSGAPPVCTDFLSYKDGQLQAKGRGYQKALKEFAVGKMASIAATMARRSRLVADEALRQARIANEGVDALRHEMGTVRARVTTLQLTLPGMLERLTARLQSELGPSTEAAALRALAVIENRLRPCAER